MELTNTSKHVTTESRPGIIFRICVLFIVVSACLPHAQVLAAPGTGATREQRIVRTPKIAEGDSVLSLLRQHGFRQEDFPRLISPRLLPKDFALIPGEVYHVSQYLASGRLEVKFYDPQEDVSFVFWREGKNSGSRRQAETFRVEIASVEGRVNGSLMAAIQEKVGHHWLAYRFMDAYVLDYDLPRLLKRGARFALTFEKKFDGSHFIRYGEIFHTRLDIRGEAVERHFVEFAGGGVFVGPDQEHEHRPFYAPVEYLHISSLYQPRRFHPVKRRRQPHLGIDFALPEGEAVFTAFAGRVIRTGRNRAAGHYVVIKHPNGFESSYNHLQTIADNVRPGVYLTNGEAIGAVGCTGYCTRPHLHFALKKYGRYVNPITYLKGFPFHQKVAIKNHIARISKN